MRYLSEENYSEAIIAFTAAIEIDPKRAEAYVGRGDAYVALAQSEDVAENFERAIQDYGEAIGIEPENAALYVKRGDTYILSGETDDTLSAALADYERALEFDGTLADAYLGMADVYIRQGWYEKAYELLKDALEKASDTTEIEKKLAEIEGGSYVDSSDHVRRHNVFNLDGELESYTEFDYDFLGRRSSWRNYNREGSESESGELKLWSYCEVTFGSNGLPESNHFYDADGEPTFYDSFEYNERGLKTKQSRFNMDGTLVRDFLYYYDGSGMLLKYEGYDGSGEMYNYWTYEYDGSGKQIKENRYSADGKLQGYATYD